MPLRDHFHPPLKNVRHWESFHAAWATEIMRTLNRNVLPEGCFAETQTHFGSQVEIDIAAFEHAPANGKNGGVAVVPWAPPATTRVMPAIFPDVFEIQVICDFGGPNLVGAIELVSPGHKDRAEARRAFAVKCASYLQQRVGLVVVDIVSDRRANLHNELIHLLQESDKFLLPATSQFYTTAYRPRRTESGDQIELWLETLTLGQPLQTMPRPSRGIGVVPLDLDGTYQRTCEDSRLP